MPDIFEAIVFLCFFRSARSWYLHSSDKLVAIITGIFYHASKYAYCKWAGIYFNSNSGGFSIYGTLCSTNSFVISSVSKCSILSSIGRRGRFMMPSLTNAFLSSSPTSFYNPSPLFIACLWTRESQLEINEQLTMTSSLCFNVLRTLNTIFFPFTIIVSSAFSTSIKFPHVVRNDLPKRIWVSSSMLKSMIIKSIGNTNCQSLPIHLQYFLEGRKCVYQPV